MEPSTEPISMPEPRPLAPSRGRLTIIFLVVVAAGLAMWAVMGEPNASSGRSSPMAGATAPEVVIDRFDGGQWTLSDHLANDGRPVVLNLWASWCLPCREEIPELTAFAQRNPDIVVVGVAVNDRETAARATAEELKPGYQVGMDALGRVPEDYPSFGMPFTVLIDGDGVIVHDVAGGVTAAQLEGLLELFAQETSARSASSSRVA